MNINRLTVIALAILAFGSSVFGQSKAEVTLSLNEPFFDALLDSVFQNFDPPQFSIAAAEKTPGQKAPVSGFAPKAECAETVKILREMNGVRTAVRFREGRVYVPLAFSGNYAPPFVGCVEFAGWAESNLLLEFDQNAQKLVGRIQVLNVNLNGTNGVGGTLIAKMIQASIDRKMNPIQILSLDKLSFAVPVQNNGNLKLRAVGVRPELGNGFLNVKVEYQFVKG